MITTTAERKPRCRYLCVGDNRCANEAVDPDGPIVLCVKHMARALEAVRDAMPDLTPVAVQRPAAKLRRLK